MSASKRDLAQLKNDLDAAADSGDHEATTKAMEAWLAGAAASTPDQIEGVLPGYRDELDRQANREW